MTRRGITVSSHVQQSSNTNINTIQFVRVVAARQVMGATVVGAEESRAGLTLSSSKHLYLDARASELLVYKCPGPDSPQVILES